MPSSLTSICNIIHRRVSDTWLTQYDVVRASTHADAPGTLPHFERAIIIIIININI
jgi:hypothetical protein